MAGLPYFRNSRISSVAPVADCAILAEVANKVDNPWTKAGAYMGLIFVIPVAGYAGYALGNYLGGKNGGDIGAIVGVGVGFFETYRQVMRIEGKK